MIEEFLLDLPRGEKGRFYLPCGEKGRFSWFDRMSNLMNFVG